MQNQAPARGAGVAVTEGAACVPSGPYVGFVEQPAQPPVLHGATTRRARPSVAVLHALQAPVLPKGLAASGQLA